MSQNTSKSIYTWTRKHLEFTLKYRLGKVCEELWQWLQSLPRVFGNKIEFELKEFIEYTAKFRLNPRTFYHAKAQFEKLVFLRIINIDKDLGHNTYRIELRHPDDIKPKIRKEKNLHYHQVSLEKSVSNPYQSETPSPSSSNTSSVETPTDNVEIDSSIKIDKEVKQEQPVDIKEHRRRLKIIQLCAKFGILFNPNKRTTDEIYKYPIEDIQSSLELYDRRRETKVIDNPQGWLIECLRNQYYEDSTYSFTNFFADITNWASQFKNNSE